MKTLSCALLLLVGSAACGPPDAPETAGDAGRDASPFADAGPPRDAAALCGVPATPAGDDVEFAPEFVPFYSAYDLGTVPGVPSPLGGTTVKWEDPSMLMIAGGSERATGAIYEIGVEREPCGHIIGFSGTASKVADAPYVDANLAYLPGSGGLLVYTQWPQWMISQLPPGATASARDIDLRAFSVNVMADSGPGGIGFVPSGYPSAGQLRAVTWPAGRWYHLEVAPDGTLFNLTMATLATTLTGQPGGFAWVPAGSPGFPTPSIIVAEWTGAPGTEHVAVYEADANGDPVPATRKAFMTRFNHPYGAYFDPVSGDYLFLSWGRGDGDHLFVVEGFVPPPPLD